MFDRYNYMVNDTIDCNQDCTVNGVIFELPAVL